MMEKMFKHDKLVFSMTSEIDINVVLLRECYNFIKCLPQEDIWESPWTGVNHSTDRWPGNQSINRLQLLYRTKGAENNTSSKEYLLV